MTNKFTFISLLKNEIPHFIALTTAFISPLFQTFYFVKVGILYTILEKLQGWGGQTYGEMGVEGIEEMHAHRIGDTPDRYDELTITKRFVGTGKLRILSRLLFNRYFPY